MTVHTALLLRDIPKKDTLPGRAAKVGLGLWVFISILIAVKAILDLNFDGLFVLLAAFVPAAFFFALFGGCIGTIVESALRAARPTPGQPTLLDQDDEDNEEDDNFEYNPDWYEETEQPGLPERDDASALPFKNDSLKADPPTPNSDKY